VETRKSEFREWWKPKVEIAFSHFFVEFSAGFITICFNFVHLLK